MSGRQTPTTPEEALARISGSATLDAIIDRQPEARRVGDLILRAIDAGHRAVVLHGGPGSGTTELMTRWVIPQLRGETEGRFDVWYGKCAADLPVRFEGPAGSRTFEEVIARPGVVILDRFGAVFDLPRDQRRAVLDRVFKRAAAGKGEGAAVVLIADSRQLTSVYALGSYDPAITDAVFEVVPVSIGDGLQQLSRVDAATAVTYSPEVQQALAQQAAVLQEQGWPVTIDLIKLVDARFRRLRAGLAERSIERADYDEAGGLEGLLRGYLEEQLTRLFEQDDAAVQIARALLDDVTEARGEIGAPGYGEIPSRLGVDPAQVAAVLKRLTEPGGLLRRMEGASYRLAPPQLALIIREDLARRGAYADRIRRLVDEAERSWSQVGNLLTRERFLEVHRARTHLVLGGEPLRFLLQCALHLEDEASSGASEYWLRRVKDPVDGMDILLASLFDDDRDVRLRAARLLGSFSAPEVRERLSAVALTDKDPDVRGQAVTTLRSRSDGASLELFMSEARDAASPHRLAAIDALRISSGDDVVRLLQELVNDPASEWPARERAVAVLAKIGTRASADALLAIALRDQDEEDRAAAAVALGQAQSDDLNRHVLESIGPLSPVMRIWVARVLVAVLASAASVVALGLGEVLWGLLLLLSVVLLIPTRRLLRQLRDGRAARTSVRGVLGIALFTLSAVSLVSLVHGLAHALIGRWRRGLLLLGLELLGILLAGGVAAIIDSVPGLEAGGIFYLIVGLAFFFGSYVYDVVPVLFETVVLTDTTRLGARRATVYRAVIGNPQAARLLFEALRSSDGGEARWARTLLRRFATSLDRRQLIGLLVAPEPQSLPLVIGALRRSKVDSTVRRLEELWRTADRQLRHWITDVLCWPPTQRSLAALDAVWAQLSLGKKLRLTAARWYFRLTVWPLALWVLVLLGIPTAGVLIYHGVMVFTNPAWSQIVSLNLRTMSEEEMVTTVQILSEHYADASAGILVDQFRSHKHAILRPAVHAALARGLITVYDSIHADDQRNTILQEVLAQAAEFYGQLVQRRDSSARQALRVLGAMASAPDSELAQEGVRLLTQFVLDTASASPFGEPAGALQELGGVPERSLPALDTALTADAIRELGGVPYERALPALDTLLTALGGGPLDGVIRQQQDTVVERVYDRLQIGESGMEGKRLLAALERLRNQPAPHLEEVRTMVAGCDRNGDRRCDHIDRAIDQIRNNPSGENGYSELLNRFVADKRFADAESQLTDLRTRYPNSIWARKTLAALYHEYLPPLDSSWSDTLAFRRSFEEMQGLRRLPTYATWRSRVTTDYLRIEADYAEVALTARRYPELDAVAGQLLRETDRPVYRFNLTLFQYIARVLQGDADSATAALDRLEQVVDSLGPYYYNAWVYPGTSLFIQRSPVPAELRSAMLRLCREGNWYNPEQAARVIAANREALSRLRMRAR